MKRVLLIKKGVFALLLALFLGMGTAYAYDFSVVVSGKTFYFNLIDATHHYVEVTYPGTYSNPYGGFTKPTGNISIPDGFYSGSTLYTVTKIGDMAFYGCSGLTGSLTIPSTVNSIGVDAFYNCSGFSGSLSVPNSVTTIGSWAFSNCGFTGSLTIGNGVTVIGAYAFYQCVSFTGSLTLGSSVTSIGQYAFQNCAGFTGSLTIPSSVTTIGNNAFQNCFGFTGTLTLGSSLTSIGDKAFYNCNKFTGSLTIPSSVTTIGESAFYNCRGFTGSLSIPNSVTTIGSEAFYYCNGFTGILTIGTGVTSIGKCAFKDCTGFTQLNYNAINCTLYTLNDNNERETPFYGCGGTLNIGNSVQTIPNFLLYHCSDFTGSLILPNSVTSIGLYAFDYCNGFTGSLTIPNSVTSISSYAFRGCTGFTGTLTVPASLTSLSDGAFSDCTGFTYVYYNAANCADVTSQTSPFYNCHGQLSIGSSVQRIPAYMFKDGGFTGSLTIPNSVTSIGNSAFYYCTGFSGSLTLSADLTSIGNYAFFGCSGFSGPLTIGSAVTSIGSNCFSNLFNLSSLTVLPNTPPSLGSSAFQNVPTTIPVYVPCASLEDYQAASGWSAFTNMQCRETLTVYEGTSTNRNVPAYIYYFDDFTRSQFVIPYYELGDMLATPISSMTFYTTSSNVPYTTTCSADVYLKEVGYGSTISAFEPKSSATIVYSGTLSIVSTGSGGEMTINFSTPYTYNGGSLLVGIENTARGGFKNIYFYGQTVNGASISGSNSSGLDYVQPTQQNFIPKTTFGYTPYFCSRPIGLTATNITPSSAVLEWTGYQDSYTVQYKSVGGFFYDFENGLDGWTVIRNGEGTDETDWQTGNIAPYSGEYEAISRSWHNGNSYSVDNWLITPRVTLDGTLTFWVKCNASYPDHYQVYVSTSGTAIDNFSPLNERSVATGEWTEIFLDLSMYAGQQGYVAIRHEDINMDYLEIDDFEISYGSSWITVSNVTSPLAIEGLTQGTSYNWQVKGLNCSGYGNYTPWSATHSFTTTDCETVLVDADHPFTEGFEGSVFAPICWESIPLNNQNYWLRSTSYGHDGSSGSAYSQYYGPIYLVLPDIELSSDAVSAQLTFWSSNNWINDFVEGNNTVVLLDGDTETVLWSAETVSQSWVETTVDLSAYLGQTISLAFKYAGNNGNGWYVDDVEVTVTNTYNFVTDGNWNDGSHWNTGSVPPAGSNVIIQADVTVPAGYLAVANAVTINGGSITVADGGQLKHNTQGLEVTMKKNIEPYTDANDLDYYLLAFPFPLGIEIPAAMTANEGCDLYKFDSGEPNAEWRNHKQTPMSNFYLANGYLYASPEPIEISVTGLTIATGYESMINITLGYTEGSDSPYNGWELLGNPFTYNAYVYRRTSDGELVPMEVMMYDENGDLQTITCGPIAPMQGFFVHLTEETTVSFRGRAHINDYVDLGLPSGLLWATCNVGADSPEDYGDYFAWGETTPKDVYNWDTYQYCMGSSSTLTKYCNNSSYGYEGFTDDLTTLLPEDDAATANWGSGWRMPTDEEWQELYNNTTVTWTTQNGVSGRLFTAANGNSLFLPAAGYRYDSSLQYAGSRGDYWSSSLYAGSPYRAWYFYFGSGDCNVSSGYRGYGRGVRPVRSASQN
ncbi:MAG: leucine-rich repeat protein [Bacteroidales bacterium]|nr:leucine-rich repeat protein [Bacteroidales bacterium]